MQIYGTVSLFLNSEPIRVFNYMVFTKTAGRNRTFLFSKKKKKLETKHRVVIYDKNYQILLLIFLYLLIYIQGGFNFLIAPRPNPKIILTQAIQANVFSTQYNLARKPRTEMVFTHTQQKKNPKTLEFSCHLLAVTYKIIFLASFMKLSHNFYLEVDFR